MTDIKDRNESNGYYICIHAGSVALDCAVINTETHNIRTTNHIIFCKG
jgi:hypothetical protein